MSTSEGPFPPYYTKDEMLAYFKHNDPDAYMQKVTAELRLFVKKIKQGELDPVYKRLRQQITNPSYFELRVRLGKVLAKGEAVMHDREIFNRVSHKTANAFFKVFFRLGGMIPFDDVINYTQMRREEARILGNGNTKVGEVKQRMGYKIDWNKWRDNKT